MGSGSFQQQYSDDRWKRRAKEFRSTYGRFCQSCRREDVVLHVHHVNYQRDVPLWDHGDEDMAMLCEACHQQIHQTIKVFRVIAARCNATNIAAMTGILHKLIQQNGESETLVKLAKLVK